VADDKRNGDDLFEDLDKFFAPIKDVDWDEPASAGAHETPSEEHVAVRPGEPAPMEPQPTPQEIVVEVAEQAPEPDVVIETHDDDEDWYDTTVLDTIDGIHVDDDEDTGEADHHEPADLVQGDDASARDVVSLEDLSMSDAPIVGTPSDQAGLFTGEDEPDEEPAEGWSLVDEDDEDAISAQVVGDLDTETAPMSTIEQEVVMTEPSDEDLRAAAEHFAPSVREEAEIEIEPEEPSIEGVVGFESDDPGSDAGGEPGAYPAPASDDLGAIGSDDDDDILSGLHADEEPQTVMVGSGEGLGGPSWQEPTSVEVGADQDRRGPGAGERDVPAAFLTGAVLAGVALAALLIGKGVFGVIAAIVVLVAQGELFGVMVKRHRQPATAVGLLAGGLMMAGAYFKGEGAILAMFSLGVIATFLWFMAGPAATRKETGVNIGLTILNMAWIPLLAGYLLVLLKEPDGTQLVVAVIALTFVYDTAAFLAGSVWGGQFFQRPLAPSVSPKKSVEGLIIGGLITVIVSVALVSQFVDPLTDKRIEALLLGLVVAAAATFGDLAESLIKRDAGIKDMSSLLPGHGGMLDRIDSLLFVAPAAFLLFRVIFG
jgi:phosphatidate cytidylyltransferase